MFRQMNVQVKEKIGIFSPRFLVGTLMQQRGGWEDTT